MDEGRGPRTRGLVLSGRRAALIVTFTLGLGSGAFAFVNATPDPSAPSAHESYVLPITSPLDQGGSDLCWAYATLSMLETDYMVRHPGSHLTLSRGALQLESIADRARRAIQGTSSHFEDGGIAVDAIRLIQQGGLVAAGDFHDIVPSDPIFASLKRALATSPTADSRGALIERNLREWIGAIPARTHEDGSIVTPQQLAADVLDGRAWAEFDIAKDGKSGWRPSDDPDARPETRVDYVGLDKAIALIHQSLARGEAVVWGSTDDHALLIYGGEYERGRPVSYLVKDSFAPYLYRASAASIHAILTDITVTVPPPAAEAQSEAATPERTVQ